jgi:hypothetical protein
LEACALNASYLAAPRYQIQLTRRDIDPLEPQGEPMGLARGRVVGLRTATTFLEADEASRIMADWMAGGSGDRPSLWCAEVVLQRDLSATPEKAA